MNDIVYYFSAKWCAPCKVVSPSVEALELKFPAVKFQKVDVDEEYELADKYSIRSMPTLVHVKDGVEVARVVGARTRDDIIKELKL